MTRPAVFLDRDGTLNVRAAEHDYIRDPRDFQWLPGAVEGMARLARSGLPLIIVSNQRGVSRGLVSEATLSAIEALIQEALTAHGCRIDAFCYCPHGAEEDCHCRKPKPGMLLCAADQMQLDLSRSWMIGDSVDDVAAGHAAGCRTVLLAPSSAPSQQTATSLLDATRLILGTEDPPVASAADES